MHQPPSAAMRAAASAAVGARAACAPRRVRVDYVLPLPGEARPPFEFLLREWLARHGFAAADVDTFLADREVARLKRRRARSAGGKGAPAREAGGLAGDAGTRATPKGFLEPLAEPWRPDKRRRRAGEEGAPQKRVQGSAEGSEGDGGPDEPRGEEVVGKGEAQDEAMVEKEGLSALGRDAGDERVLRKRVEPSEGDVKADEQGCVEDVGNGNARRVLIGLDDEGEVGKKSLDKVNWLTVVERDAATGEADWVACRLCLCFGCPGRKEDYICMHAWPFDVSEVFGHVEKHHQEKWGEYLAESAEKRATFFEGEKVPDPEVLAMRVAQLKKNWGATREERKKRFLKRKKFKEQRLLRKIAKGGES